MSNFTEYVLPSDAKIHVKFPLEEFGQVKVARAVWLSETQYESYTTGLHCSDYRVLSRAWGLDLFGVADRTVISLLYSYASMVPSRNIQIAIDVPGYGKVTGSVIPSLHRESHYALGESYRLYGNGKYELHAYGVLTLREFWDMLSKGVQGV